MPKHPVPPPNVQVATSIGGEVVFASDAVLATMDRLRVLAEELHGCETQLRHAMNRADLEPSAANAAPYAAAEAHRRLEDAARILGQATPRAQRIRHGMQRALHAYSNLERGVESEMHVVDEGFATLLGGEALLVAAPLLAVFGPMIRGSVLSHSYRMAGGAIGDFFSRHPALLNNRYSVAAIRELVSDVDAFESGACGLPPGIAISLNRLGLRGVTTAASDVARIGNAAGAFVETPVSVHKTSSFDGGSAPTSLLDRSKSFPSAHDDPNGEQIRIVKYDIPGKAARFDVFIGGTATFDPVSKTQPFDLTSDVQGVANHSSASVRAVEQALEKAGVTRSTPVVLNGYSQGGLVASLVAASGKYDVHGVVTFGAPSGAVHLPATVPVLSVRNSEDIVTGLGGYDTNDHALVVQRTLFAHGGPPPGDPFAAHRLSYYQQTAAAVDGAHSSEVRSMLDKLNSFGSGAIGVQSTMWLATRTKP